MADEKDQKDPTPAAPAAPATEEKKAKEKRPKKVEPQKEEKKAPQIKKLEGVKEDFRYIVRLANTDLNGARSVIYALTGIKGMGVRMAEAVADLAQVPRRGRIGDLDEAPVGRG